MEFPRFWINIKGRSPIGEVEGIIPGYRFEPPRFWINIKGRSPIGGVECIIPLFQDIDGIPEVLDQYQGSQPYRGGGRLYFTISMGPPWIHINGL